MPATSMMIFGGPGSGKTTLTLEMLSSYEEQGLKCLYICGEMNRINYAKYCRRMPNFNKINVLFLNEYNEDPYNVLKEVLEQDGHHEGL